MTQDPRHAILKRWIMGYASDRSELSASHFADEALKEMDALPTKQTDFEEARLNQLADGYEWLARAECRRQGIDPDESITDGGYLTWQLVGHDAVQRELNWKPPAPRATDDPSDPHLTLTLCIANALINGAKSLAIATNVADGVREFEEKRERMPTS